MFARSLLAGLAILAFSLPAAALPAGLDLEPAEARRVEQGDVVVQLRETTGSALKNVVCVGYVEAPSASVWRVITDYDHYPRIFPGILKSETRSVKGPVETHYTLLDYPWPLPDKWTLNEITHRPPQHISWRRVDGSVKELVGSWRLYPEGDRTLVVYSVRVDPGLPLVPRWAIQWGTTRVAPNIVKNLRKHV